MESSDQINGHTKPRNSFLQFEVQCSMDKLPLKQRLKRANEITHSGRGRKSGRDFSRPVWFVHEDDTVYLLPVQGSDTNWYKNFFAYPTLKISVRNDNNQNGGEELSAGGQPITASTKVDDVVRKFKSKYGEGNVKKYYPKTDVAVRIEL